MAKLAAPHGSDRLNPPLVPVDERTGSLTLADGRKRVPLTSREGSDLPIFAKREAVPPEFGRPEAVAMRQDQFERARPT